MRSETREYQTSFTRSDQIIQQLQSNLKKLKNGTFKGTFDLPVENSYEFRYLVDGNYINDAEADRYQWNDYAGTENAVLEV